MNVQTFVKQEVAYRDWINTHPRGFVLNTHAKLSPGYMVLHRATCRHVTEYFGNATVGGFTERKYRKICSDAVAPIRYWVKEQGGTLTSCSHCDSIEDELRAYERDLVSRVKQALSDKNARRARLLTAPEVPETISVTTTVYVRNPDVVAEVLYLADGKCNGCGRSAPFLRKDGTPYLEVHHVLPLSQEGKDTVENAEALCPNCHRKAHFGVGGTDG